MQDFCSISNHPDLVGIIPILLGNPKSRLMHDRDKKNSAKEVIFVNSLNFTSKYVNLPSIFDKKTRLEYWN